MARDWFDENGFDQPSIDAILANDGVSQTKPIGSPQTLPNTGVTGIGTVPGQTATPAASIGNVGHNDTTTGGLNREQWRDKWLSHGPTDLNGLKQFLAENGGTLVSENGTVTTPFGDTLDIGAGARTGVITPAWTQVGAASDGPVGGASGGGYGGGAASTAAQGSLGRLGQSPQAQGNFNAPQGTQAGQFNYGQGVPQLQQLQTASPLTAEQLAADPTFNFIKSQGEGALLNQASARGSVRDANVYKGLIDYGQQAASQYANQANNQNLAYMGANNAAISGNNANALGAQGQGFGQALSGYNANLGALGQNYNQAANTWGLNTNAALGFGNLGLGQTQAANSYALGQGQLGLGQQNFALNAQNQNWNQAFQNNAQNWNQYYQLSQLGLQ